MGYGDCCIFGGRRRKLEAHNYSKINYRTEIIPDFLESLFWTHSWKWFFQISFNLLNMYAHSYYWKPCSLYVLSITNYVYYVGKNNKITDSLIVEIVIETLISQSNYYFK